MNHTVAFFVNKCYERILLCEDCYCVLCLAYVETIVRLWSVVVFFVPVHTDVVYLVEHVRRCVR
jgi:hypothetical protein